MALIPPINFKQWIEDSFVLYEIYPVTGFFNLTLVYNTGAAFSFLSDAGGWQRWMFIGLALAVTLFIMIWLRRLPRTGQTLLAIALSLIVGGALGNVIDRAMRAVPVLHGARVIERWAGLRPRARTRAPMLGAWPGRGGHYVVNGGFKIGFGVAPKVGLTSPAKSRSVTTISSF